MTRIVRALWGAGVAALVGLGIAGCGAPSTEPVVERRDAERRWAAGIGAASQYVMRQQRLCFCLHVDTVRLTVAGGRITAAVNERTGAALSTEERSSYRSVEQLFATLDAVPAAGGRIQRVQFHPTEGYPTQLAVDPIPMAADDETDWRTVQVQRGPPQP